MPLARALSKLGLASRAEARRLIEAGRVTVDGRPASDPRQPLVPEQSTIAIDGVRRERPAAVTVMLHKPRGIVTTRVDPQGRPTAFDLVRDAAAHLVAVGRLDLASTGLLLFTNDTRLAAALTDPAAAVTRVYDVTVRGRVDDETAATLTGGLDVDGELLTARAVRVRKRSARESHLIVTLAEGRNREIRRLLLAVGHEVTGLRRVQFGRLALGDLAPGRWRRLTAAEVAALAGDAGL